MPTTWTGSVNNLGLLFASQGFLVHVISFKRVAGIDVYFVNSTLTTYKIKTTHLEVVVARRFEGGIGCPCAFKFRCPFALR